MNVFAIVRKRLDRIRHLDTRESLAFFASRLFIETRIAMRYGYYRFLLSGLLGSMKFSGYSRIYGTLFIQEHPCNIYVGRNTRLGRGVFFAARKPAIIRIGDGSTINSYCHVVASESIMIGNSVSIAEMVSIRDQEHHFNPECGTVNQGFKIAPVVIEENCWIGRGAYIGPGSVVRKGSIVAANSVVRGEFPPNSLIAGMPATVRRNLS